MTSGRGRIVDMEKIWHRLRAARHWAAVATAFLLPLSTSGQAIAISVFALLAVLTLEPRRLIVRMQAAAAWLPVAVFMLVLIGVLWSMQPPLLSIKSAGAYAKLLLIPLIMATAMTPRQALQIGYGFLAACGLLLALSLISLAWPTGPWGWLKAPGIPVKDNAVQSASFALCAFALALVSIRAWSQKQRPRALVMITLALLFLADIVLIFVSKTGLLMTGALFILLLLHMQGWRRVLLVAAPILMVAVVSFWASTPAQQRLAEFSADMRVETQSSGSVSTAARIDFWHKAANFIRTAPLLGHGTGSITPLYQAEEASTPSPYGSATHDPHNQILHISIQVGLIGAALLLAMWAAHAMLFVGRSLPSALGQAVVLQNVIGSLFNSHISTVTLGMLYCLAIGVLGSVVLMQRETDARSVPI